MPLYRVECEELPDGKRSHSGTRLLAWARHPYALCSCSTRNSVTAKHSLQGVWILRCAIAHRSSRYARPGMTVRSTVARAIACGRAEHRNLVDRQHQREGDDQHRDAQNRNRGEIAAFVEIVDQYRDHLG